MLITLDQLKTSLQAMKNYVIGLVPTKVSELQNDSGYLTTETDPTVPSWAKAQTKPSYTADEVGAASVNIVADDYDSSSMYVVGDMVIYDGLLYQCICQIDSESWNPAHWRQVTVNDEIKQSNRKIDYNKRTAEYAYLHKSESGSLVHIMDGADGVPLRNVSVDIKPIQSGSGDPTPSNIRPIYGWDGTRVYSSMVSPINFIPLNDSSWQSNGATLKYLGNGTYEVGEIPEGATAIFNVDIEPFTLSSNYNLFLLNSTIRHAVGEWDFVFSLRDSEHNNKGAFQTVYNKDFNDFIVTFNSDLLGNIEITRIRFVISPSMSGVRFTPMFLSKNYVSYVEWGNIAGLVYGGDMSFTTGVLTSRWTCIDSYNGEELPGEWISDRDVYTSGATPTIGAQVVYRLAQSQTYKLEVKLPARTTYLENYIWALTGDISFSYAIDQQTSFDAKMPNVTFGTKTTLFDTTTLSFSKDGDNDWYCTAENPIQGFTSSDFLYDAVYKITWDGVEYDELFVQEHEMAQISTNTQRVTGWYDWRCIGNASILGYHNYYETNAPFCVAYDFHRNEAEIQIFTLSTEASHTIKIERIPYTKKLTPIQYYTDTIRGRSPITWGSGEYAIVEGEGSIASGASSHSEGCTSIARGNYSHSEGEGTITDGRASHAEGYYTEAKGIASHAEGQFNIASGSYGAHAEGYQTEAKGTVSHSEGLLTLAKGFISHTEGYQTVANNKSQHVFGEYNIIDTTQDTTVRGVYVEIVGNGTDNARSNARTLDWSGNEVLAGKLTVGTAPTNNMDVATKGYVDNLIPSVPVTDVQVNGSSVLSNGVANVPVTSENTAGVAKINPVYGIHLRDAPNNDQLMIYKADSSLIKAGSNQHRPIVPQKQHESVFYGLAKAAGADMASSDNAVGTYTSEAKSAIQSMLGISDGYVTKQSIENAGITAKSYTTVFDGEFTVTTATTTGYNNPYARASATGRFYKEKMYRVTFNGTEYTLQTRLWYSNVSPSNHKVYEYLGNLGLYISDITGVPNGTDGDVPFVIISNLNNSSSIDVLTSTAGTYTILIEQIDNTQKVLPTSLIYGDYNAPLVKKVNAGSVYDGLSFGVNELNNANATFAFGYGNKVSNNNGVALGSWNKVSGSGGIAVGNSSIVSGGDSIVIGNQSRASGSGAVAIGNINTASGMSSFATNVANTASGDYSSAFGVSNTASGESSSAFGNGNSVTGSWSASFGQNNNISGYWSIAFGYTNIANHAGQLVFGSFNVADPSSAAADRQGNYVEIVGNGSNNNTRSNAYALDWSGNGYFGGNIYVNCDSSSANGTRLPHDIQVNGTSVVSNGVANIPVAAYQVLGAVSTNGDYGISASADGRLNINSASDALIKEGVQIYRPIVSANQHTSVFYGLAKAAGDTTQSQSDNAVGTYTTEAQTAIKTMLGVTDTPPEIFVGSTTPSGYTIYIDPDGGITSGEEVGF